MEETNTRKVKIFISEGCIAYSYCINEIEWVELVDPSSKKYDPSLVNAVCGELLDELEDQYPDIPSFLIYNLYEVGNSKSDVDFDQDIFIGLVKSNKNTIRAYLGTCDECGDSIETYELTIDVPNYNL